MTDSKYFTTTKKGEIFELKGELNSDKKEKKREAVKKVIASMTVGKDVSALFPDVVNCMQTDNLELKKLVYLYLMNYAKSHPDMAIMAVNIFVKDCEDSNPLIRALAVRTMGCIRVDKITEYLCEPLRKCLKDEDPYVRKTAAVCVAKLYDINAQLVEDQGFLDQLKDLLSDSNPMVVANAVAAVYILLHLTRLAITVHASSDPAAAKEVVLAEKPLISEETDLLEPTLLDELICHISSLASVYHKPPHAFVEGNILYICHISRQSICERITPRLAHANAAVVLSAVKVLMKLMEMLPGEGDFVSTLTKKLAPPLVTLLSSEPEVQYVALRNINLIVQKRPDILKHEMKVFFVKYNDPIYVKLEKLDIMIRLASQANIAQVLSELKEYATEVDVDFVRKAVRAIGRCAIKVEQSAERCVSTLLDLIQTKVNFRASMIWIIGEYAERIDNADELLESFLEGFHDENTQVQLQLLTAIVKLFLKRPTDTQELVQQVLSLATQDSDNPDLRDRGFIYWRLLSTGVVIASMTVGKDVSALFPDVVNCMQTDNLELKKLVYLYLMNYAKSHPDMAIMAVNTFVKDCEDSNPLIRALAVRTMGCIRVDKITEYLCEPLRKCLKDEDPYVRKTAAVCVAKLYDINAQLVEDQGFLDQLKDLLSDSNPMVVANAVAALSEMNEASTSGVALIEMNAQTINKLLTALNECTEWGQVFILDSLSNYSPKDDREAQSICERITPRLAHANAAVVLSAVKVLMKLMEMLPGEGDFVSTLTKKLAPPLVTLLSSEPEVQYVALRNINLIVQKRPDILKHEMKVFFVKYNDPIYVKLEKLDIMIRLASQANIAQVNYVVQEAIVVIKDIFRKYPNKYETIISTLCENLDTLDEPEARASMIWIIGEYAERIDNADELLESFLE
ncbi:AP-1 complex subunit beta-1-like, partial [Diaphorina citri]|uniref:AP-1 complex subunit beta-1-like n=1 Tax=Diaphorina citri TaxID=121845 RepID=A0A3Q0J6T7_DIACI